MPKLTDIQLKILSKATAGEDGVAIVPAKMNRGAATKAGSSLVARKLMREIRSKPGMPVWREDDTGKNISLIITRAGREAIGMGIASKEAVAAIVTRKGDRKNVDASDELRRDAKVASRKINDVDAGDESPSIPSPRTGSKLSMVIAMLSGEPGATLNDIVNATGWLPHTTRAALTGLRKRGLVLVRSRDPMNVSTYRITDQTARVAA